MEKTVNCRYCVDIQQTGIIATAVQRVKKIKLKTEAEIVTLGRWSSILTDQEHINVALAKITPRNVNGKILVLDLHDTIDLFFGGAIKMNQLQQLRNSFDLVVILSFVGKGMKSTRIVSKHGVDMQRMDVHPSSKRYLARVDMQTLIATNTIDYGVLVFQRGASKGWICDILRKVYDRDILFADDSDDHLEAVRNTLPQRNYLAGIHKSDPTNPDGLFQWIEDNV